MFYVARVLEIGFTPLEFKNKIFEQVLYSSSTTSFLSPVKSYVIKNSFSRLASFYHF